MSFNYNDCIKANLLRRVPPSKDKALQSLKKATVWLKESEKSYFISVTNTAGIGEQQ